MATFNQVLQALSGAMRASPAPTSRAQDPELQGTGASLATVIQQMLGADPAQGIAALVQTFEAAGLANVIKSWIGTGTNQAISTEQLQSALGAERLNQLAQTANMDKSRLLSNLSKALPGVIDAMTPNGKVPASVILRGIMAQLTGSGAPQQPPRA